MKPSARKIIEDRKAATARLEAEAPALREGFGKMIAAYYAPGALDLRGKELAAVACSVAIGVEFGGGPAYTIARDHLLDFLDEIEAGN